MKKSILIAFLLFILVEKNIALPIDCNRQEGKGVNFEQSLSWRELKAKAKQEHKFIFVDCYASWCGPCKEMDLKVYPFEKLGDFMNVNFISIKVQFDSSLNDNQDIKRWYSDSHEIIQQFHVKAFPSFLFFSPDGQIVDRDLGYKNDSEFMAMAKKAMDPQQQYYTLLTEYNKGNKDYPSLGKLAVMAKNIGDENTANVIANDYINNYLLSLKNGNLYTKENIMFIVSFVGMLNSKDRFFSLFYPDGSKVDSIMNYNISQQVVDEVIIKEDIDPVTKNALANNLDAPDWNIIETSIADKYKKDVAERLVLQSKVRWYAYITAKYNRDWDQYINYKIEEANKYETDTTNPFIDFDHNNFAYNVILFHSTDKSQIESAIKWMKNIVRKYPTDSGGLAPYAGGLDTYASLVYKAGRRKEAISIEEKAARCDPKSEYYPKMVSRMKKGELIWLKQ